MPITIDKPSKYFNTKLYTGNGTSQSITGVGFKPDLTWLKGRDFTPSIPALVDSVRGRSKDLYSDRTSAEETSGSTEDLTSFDTDGFSLGSSARFQSNNNGQTFVSWNWKANGTGVSNTAGTISSTVSANTTSGFSIVSYTGTGGVPVTVGHGLGITPEVLIIKNRTNAYNWAVYHKDLGNTGGLFLNTTSAFTTDADLFNNTSPTSSVVTFSNSTLTNQGSANHIMYAFNSVKGFSKFGKYTGNNSTDGTFVYTGFKPAFVMIKTTSAAEAWNIGDNKRNITYPAGANVNNAELYANSSSAETDRSTRGGGTTQFDMLSNGFKCRGVNPDINYTGYNYIYMAFAENPFVSSKGVCTTAR
jgi:hypothetical protein